MWRGAATSLAVVFLALACVSCAPEQTRTETKPEPARPSILLVTLDTTRADSVRFENDGVQTPAIDAVLPATTVDWQGTSDSRH